MRGPSNAIRRCPQKGGRRWAEKLGRDGYEASSALGRLTSYTSLGMGIVFGSLLILVGGWVLSSRHGESAVRLRGKVMNSECTRLTGENTHTSCAVEVEYTFRGDTYRTHVTTSERKAPDQTVKLVIPAPDERPQDAKQDNDAMKFYAGWTLLAVGVLIIGGVITTFYIVQSSKLASAAYGVGSAVSMASSAIR